METETTSTSQQPQQPNRFYVVPCMLTICSLFCGFYSIISSFEGQFFYAAIAILAAAVFDGLDGRVARMTGSTSNFGMELDSLCDMVAFGVAPGILAYLWALTPYGRYGWLAAFCYVAATALRLARFNAQSVAKLIAQQSAPAPCDNNEQQCSGSISTNHDFTGLPCPAAAAMIATAVMFSTQVIKTTDTVQHVVLVLMVYLLGYLMISTHRYPSFKHVDIPKEKRFHLLIGLVLFLVALLSNYIVPFLTTLGYIALGPALAIKARMHKKEAEPVQQEARDQAADPQEELSR
jgi:CDP-diacylglycerol--serine O-phosphatidyltransferase